MNISKIQIIILVILAMTNTNAIARDVTKEPSQGQVQLSLALIDTKLSLRQGYSFPSMQQSLQMVWIVDRLTVLGIQKGYEILLPTQDGLRLGLGIATETAAAFGLLFVNGWMHEEWHHTVLSAGDVSSRNGFFHREAWKDGIVSVDHVTDEDLTRLKADSPAYMVRAMSAGIEAELTLVTIASNELFFHGGHGRQLGPFLISGSYMAPLLFLTTVSTIGYPFLCMDPTLDEIIDEENKRLTDWQLRDFTGPDCTAWVYDMFRPDESYTKRGPHPSGVGIKRYIKWSDLAPREQAYLKRQSRLHLINLINPHLYWIDGVVVGIRTTEDRWIASLGHILTPWGYTLDVRIGLKYGEFAGKIVLHNGFAEAGYFPGLDLALIDFPLSGQRLILDLAVGLWLQPSDLRYDGRRRVPGGRSQIQLSWRALPRFDLWAQISAKTEGWVMGEIHLKPAVNGAIGFTVHSQGQPQFIREQLRRGATFLHHSNSLLLLSSH
ncbi:hypothetical protein FJZ31_29420 [Candidatus Poribacteria bacterium]|nr:hypothetical protein [Candidatus Poribacteria bacterium]